MCNPATGRKSPGSDDPTRLKMRAVRKELAVKQFDKTEKKLTDELTVFFQAQLKSIQRNMRTATGTNPDRIMSQCYDPRDWDRPLYKVVVPIMAQSMVEGAAAELVMLGYDPRKLKKSARTGRKATGTFELLGVDIPEGVGKMLPDWMVDQILSELSESMSQPHWKGINDTTADRVEGILIDGLSSGQSVRDIADNLMESMPETYSRSRATLVARTESGNALNAGRDISYQRLKDELPPEASKFINKEWLSVLGSTTRADHADADGQLADEDGMFDLAGYSVPWPGHYDLPVEQRANCLCSTELNLGDGAPEDEIQQILAEGELTGDSIDDLVPDELTPIGVDAPPEDAPPQVQPWNGTADDILRFIAEDPEIEQVAAKFIEEHAETLVDMEKRQRSIDEKRAEHENLRQKILRMMDAEQNESDPDKKAALIKERNAFYDDRIQPINKELSDARDALESIIEESRKSLYEPIENRSGMVMRVRTRDAEVEQKAIKANEFINSVMVKKVQPPEFDLKLTSQKRAFYLHTEMSVNVDSWSFVTTHVHEIAHHVEHYGGRSGMAKASEAFIDARVKAAGTKDVNLSQKFPSWGFKSWEVGNEDSFRNVFKDRDDGEVYAHYTGKKYKRFGGNSDATELISMGVERLYRNPVTFAKQDPEYFKFILGVMKGKFVE